MEKVYGATERHDQLIVHTSGTAVLIYGYGEDDCAGYDWRESFDTRPSSLKIRETIIAHINDLTDAKILNGYKWTIMHGDMSKPEESRHAGETVNVWLSMENQNNFKEAHRLACLDPSKVIPVKFKISEDSEMNAIYETFMTFEELNTFYLGAFSFIKKTLDDGWVEKESIDMTKFET